MIGGGGGLGGADGNVPCGGFDDCSLDISHLFRSCSYHEYSMGNLSRFVEGDCSVIWRDAVEIQSPCRV